MNKKNLPLLLMLVAGIVSCIYTFILQYSTLKKLVYLFIVMLVVYFLCCIIIWVVDCFQAESEMQLNKEEGEIIEGDTEGQEDAESQEGAEGLESAQVKTEEEESEESRSPA